MEQDKKVPQPAELFHQDLNRPQAVGDFKRLAKGNRPQPADDFEKLTKQIVYKA